MLVRLQPWCIHQQSVLAKKNVSTTQTQMSGLPCPMRQEYGENSAHRSDAALSGPLPWHNCGWPKACLNATAPPPALKHKHNVHTGYQACRVCPLWILWAS